MSGKFWNCLKFILEIFLFKIKAVCYRFEFIFYLKYLRLNFVCFTMFKCYAINCMFILKIFEMYLLRLFKNWTNLLTTIFQLFLQQLFISLWFIRNIGVISCRWCQWFNFIIWKNQISDILRHDQEQISYRLNNYDPFSIVFAINSMSI